MADRVDCGTDFDSVISDALDVLTECDQADVSSALEPDSDHDGYPRQVDCDDRDPGIAPGRPDAPGDGIDQDCDGHDARVIDADGDGSPVPADCNDRDAGVHPGAAEVFGNAYDENCDGRNNPYQTLNPQLTVGFRSQGPRKRFTRVTAFSVAGLPSGTSLRLTCRGVGCPFGTTSATTSGSATKFEPKLRRAKLGTAAVLELVLRRRDALTATFTYTVRRGIATTRHACARPDSGRTVRCDVG